MKPNDEAWEFVLKKSRYHAIAQRHTRELKAILKNLTIVNASLTIRKKR